MVGSNRQVRGKLQQESSLFRYLEFLWIPVFTGMTTFYEFINLLFLSSMEARRPEGAASRARSGEQNVSQGNFILIVPLDPAYKAGLTGHLPATEGKG